MRQIFFIFMIVSLLAMAKGGSFGGGRSSGISSSRAGRSGSFGGSRSITPSAPSRQSSAVQSGRSSFFGGNRRAAGPATKSSGPSSTGPAALTNIPAPVPIIHNHYNSGYGYFNGKGFFNGFMWGSLLNNHQQSVIYQGGVGGYDTGRQVIVERHGMLYKIFWGCVNAFVILIFLAMIVALLYFLWASFTGLD